MNEACLTVEIDPATYRRWQCDEQVIADRRAKAQRALPINRLTQAEHEMILLTCDLLQFQRLPPSQIVPTLADMRRYIGSESSLYCLLR